MGREKRVYKLYSELKRLKDGMFSTAGRNTKDFVEWLDRLGNRASRFSLQTPFNPLIYSLRLHIDIVRHNARNASCWKKRYAAAEDLSPTSPNARTPERLHGR